MEELLDQYLPLTENQKHDNYIPPSPRGPSDSPYDKIKRKMRVIKSRLLFAVMVKVSVILSFPMQLKAAYMDGTLKKKIHTHFMNIKCSCMSTFKYAKARHKRNLSPPRNSWPVSRENHLRVSWRRSGTRRHVCRKRW